MQSIMSRVRAAAKWVLVAVCASAACGASTSAVQPRVEATQPPAGVTAEQRCQFPERAPDGVFDVWPEGKMPGRGAAEAETDRPQKDDGVQRITNVSHPTLTLFKAAGKGAPAMIVSPGGGYTYVTFNKEGTEIAAWLNSAGITAVVLKYRVPGNREGALQDIQRALSLTRARAAEWNIDPKRLGVIGFSAGGNLSAKASNRFGERAYPVIDEIDQQSCRPDFAILVYPAYLGKDGQVAADLNLEADIPPTLIIQSADDQNYVGGTKIYQAALDRAGRKNVFLLYPTGGHGYALRGGKDARVWPQAALEWLRTTGICPDGER